MKASSERIYNIQKWIELLIQFEVTSLNTYLVPTKELISEEQLIRFDFPKLEIIGPMYDLFNCFTEYNWKLIKKFYLPNKIVNSVNDLFDDYGIGIPHDYIFYSISRLKSEFAFSTFIHEEMKNKNQKYLNTLNDFLELNEIIRTDNFKSFNINKNKRGVIRANQNSLLANFIKEACMSKFDNELIFEKENIYSPSSITQVKNAKKKLDNFNTLYKPRNVVLRNSYAIIFLLRLLYEGQKSNTFYKLVIEIFDIFEFPNIEKYLSKENIRNYEKRDIPKLIYETTIK